MTTATTTLTEFLLARIAEDEVWARNAGNDFANRMQPDSSARVLAECEAKRRIVEAESGTWTLREDVAESTERVARWTGADVVEVKLRDGGWEHITTAEFHERYMVPSPPSKTLKLLALPYADHPDYRPEWRP